MTRRGFSLIEILVATVLAALLMTGVLFMLAGVARDRKTVTAINAASNPSGVVDLIAWDLGNARSMSVSTDGASTVLTGMCGIDPVTLDSNGRLVRVTYRLSSGNLWRSQEYLDDPVHRSIWRELVATGATDFSITSAAPADSGVPDHVRLVLVTRGQTIDRTVRIR